MADASAHAASSAKRFGGQPDDYLFLHQWFDSTKSAWCDQRHRAVLHSSFGIELAIQVFGQTFRRKSDNRAIPTRWIGEQHINEDCGFVPTLEDWLGALPLKDWMARGARKFVREFTLESENAQVAE
jgi:hypothetical protein